jgi:hypothetical protein
LIEAFKPLLEKIRAEANNPNSNLTAEQRQQLLKMADDIERLLPVVLRNAKEAINDPAQYNNFSNAMNDLKRIIERATDIVSSPYDEKSIHDGIKDVLVRLLCHFSCLKQTNVLLLERHEHGS